MNNIQAMRNKANMTQESVAKALTIDRSTVAKWETGIANPRADMLVSLARILNCTIDELLNAHEPNVNATA